MLAWLFDQPIDLIKTFELNILIANFASYNQVEPAVTGRRQAFTRKELLVITCTQSENAAPQITEYVIQIRYLNSNLLGGI